ncbi:MAG: GtrA family protein [Elusimicrobiota bacterium]|nr:GtrA family protein [Elusimicrobiota bacterium]
MEKKEFIRYVCFGFLTTIINIGIFQLFLFVNIDYKIANLIALFFSRAFAYFSNKRFVFKTHSQNFKDLLKEILRFIIARGITAIIDFIGLIFAVEFLNLAPMISKYILVVIAIIVNFVLAKTYVYKSK